MCIIEKNARNITVRMSNTRWKRLMELEKAYRLAKSVTHAKQECEKTPGMSITKAMNLIDNL